jgi:hypothetical protein
MNASGNCADGGDAADAGAAQDPSDRLRSGPLADEQAGLRRLAALVAGGARLAMGPYGAWVGGLGMRVGVAMTIVLAGRAPVGRDGGRDFAGGLAGLRLSPCCRLASVDF